MPENMINKQNRNEYSKAACTASSKAWQITEKFTLKTSPLTTANIAKLALPPAQQTIRTTSLPAPGLAMPNTAQSALLNSTTRNSIHSVTTKRISSLSYMSSLATTISKAKTEIAKSSASSENLKLKQILKNLTPEYFLTTLAATIATKVKHNDIKNSEYDSWTNSICSQANVATNRNVTFQKIQQSDKKKVYHMLSLNHQNCTNIFQHQTQQLHHQKQQQQQKNKPQRQCCNKSYQQQQQQKVKQFLLLLTCFVAIITIFSLPHLSTATILNMSTTYVTPTTTSTTANKTLKSLITTNTKTYYELQPLSSSSSSTIFNSFTDNESKDDDNTYNNKIADKSDNVDDFTSSPLLAATIKNSLRNFTHKSVQDFHRNHFIARLKRSLDVRGNSGVTSGMSSIFSTSPGSAASLTNIFNQNLDSGLSNSIECPSFDESSACPCYKFEDGLFLECPGTTATSLRTTLERISSPIHSLSIYDFDRSVTSLSQDVFQPGVNIRHLQFSHSHLETLKENSLKNVRTSLESLSIVNGKLTQLVTIIVLFNMKTKLIFLAIFAVLLAYAESSRDRCDPICHKNEPVAIRCVKDGKVCRKIRQCSMQEINCRRSLLNRKHLAPTSSAACRNIKSSLGTGPCATIRKPRSTRLNCDNIRCTVPSKELYCYRSKKNNCRLLTSCKLARANCRRSPGNSLEPTHPLACAGFKRAGKRQRCRPIAKKG